MTKSKSKTSIKSTVLNLIKNKEAFRDKNIYVVFSVNDQSPHVEAEIEELKIKDSDLEGYEGYDGLPLDAYFIDFSLEVDADGYGVLAFDAIFKTFPHSNQIHKNFILCKKVRSYLNISPITRSKITEELCIWQNAAKAFYLVMEEKSSFIPLTQFIDEYLINAAKDAGIYKAK